VRYHVWGYPSCCSLWHSETKASSSFFRLPQSGSGADSQVFTASPCIFCFTRAWSCIWIRISSLKAWLVGFTSSLLDTFRTEASFGVTQMHVNLYSDLLGQSQWNLSMLGQRPDLHRNICTSARFLLSSVTNLCPNIISSHISFPIAFPLTQETQWQLRTYNNHQPKRHPPYLTISPILMPLLETRTRNGDMGGPQTIPKRARCLQRVSNAIIKQSHTRN
jgi:hypothetical protein